MACEAKSTTLGKPKSRQRQRTERAATELLSEVRLSPARKRAAIERIRNAGQPMAEARRIVACARQDELRQIVRRDEYDLSDVQELRARLIRKRGMIDLPHGNVLARMDAMIASGDMDRETYDRMAGLVLAMPVVLPQVKNP